MTGPAARVGSSRLGHTTFYLPNKMNPQQDYDEKRAICLAKWAEYHSLKKTFRDMMYTWPRLPQKDIDAARVAWLDAMDAGKQAGKQMRLAKEHLDLDKTVCDALMNPDNYAAVIRALMDKQKAAGIPLFTEDGHDLKCAWCNSRFPDKKRDDGEYVHEDCE